MGINEKNSRWRDKGTEIKQSIKAQLIYLTGKILKVLNVGAFLTNKYNDVDLVTIEFELIQNEIDIDSIEEIKWRESEKEYLGFGVLVANDKINELVQAVKQLNKKLEKK